jgi:tetratricopeptide (TPR) repeat protein
MRPALGLLLVFSAGACAYYNGLYNARGLVRRAESATREGRDSAAVAAWREAAAKADTVIARYPRSRWTDDALLVSGTSAAFSGACEHGLERLGQWERHPAADRKKRARASVARGVCLVRLGDHGRALDTLAPFIAHDEETLSRIAAAWAARAALATGRIDSAVTLADKADSDVLDAELATSALESGRHSVAARILRQRASEWRSLEPGHAPLRALARIDRALANGIVALTQNGRASRLERARLSVAAGSWSEQAGDVHGARGHYDRALRMSSDTALVTDVITRAGLLEVRSATTIGEAQIRLDRAKAKAVDVARLAAVDSALSLAGRLVRASDSTGASLFLAAEVARDAVGAVPLARALFLEVTREHARSSLAPRALLAAAALTPDSTEAWRARVLDAYATSPYAQALSGKPISSSALDADERLLHQVWTRARVTRDSASVAAERRPP